MAFSVNKAVLLGNIGSDLELREVGDSCVVNFSLATNERYKKRGEDEYTEKTEWHRITVWGKPAEIICDHAHKGSKLYVEGQLQTRKYEKDGVEHYSTEVNVREFVILDAKPDSNGGGGGSRMPKEEDNDDYPF